VFVPPQFDEVQKRVNLEGYTCAITGLYPMYSSEFKLYERIGLDQFWHLAAWDPLNPKRPRIE
jgi:hypothetical protein